MQRIEPIEYNPNISLLRNFNALKKQTGLKTENIAYECNISASSVNVYINNRFRTHSGAQSDVGERLKAVISKYFIGGIPEDVLARKQKQQRDLYALFKCGSCKFRMRSQPGCYKFSHTKVEINNGAWVEPLTGGGFNLSPKNRCPHAR